MISKDEITAIFCGVMISMAIMLIMMVSLLKLLWAWIVPELLPGAVAQGLIVPVLSWSLAFKLVLFGLVLVLFFSRKSMYFAPGSNKS